MSKIFDCITFFNENLMTNLRFEILNDKVDYFIVCESLFDHQGNKKPLNFNLENNAYKNKIIYLVHDKPFNNKNNAWENQAAQREHILSALKIAEDEDYIMFGDPDEIPNPRILSQLNLEKKYGLFLQKMYCYKFNIFNPHETPWEGTNFSR